MQRKNPAAIVYPKAEMTRDGVPQALYGGGIQKTGGKKFPGQKGKHSVHQGAAERSNRSTSVGGFEKTPITVKPPPAKGKISPNDILAAMTKGK